MIDCDLLSNGCSVGINVSLKVINNGDDYVTTIVNETINGEGFQIAENIQLNSPLSITSIYVDDSFSSPSYEVDLSAGETTAVTCQGVVRDYDGENDTLSVYGEFFDTISSAFGNLDDNNDHYTNSSCFLNHSYGNINETQFICNYYVTYYASSNSWNCTVKGADYLINHSASNTTFINPLMAIELPSTIDYGLLDTSVMSNESVVNITNKGNVVVNLTLEGYAVSRGDNLSMNCSDGMNISVNFQNIISLHRIQAR